MSIRQLKEALHLKIEQIDERFLKVMYAMAETYLNEQDEAALEKQLKDIEPNPDWKPMTEEELIESYKIAASEYKKGNYKTIEDVEKESEEW